MGYDAAFERLETQALFDLKGTQSAVAKWAGKALPAFPGAPNQMTRSADASLCWIGRDHWILRAELAQEDTLARALRLDGAPPEISVVQISDMMAFYRITGAQADQVMSIGCPLDLHLSVFGADAVSFTEFFNLRALVTRAGDRFEDGFDVGVEQSFGPMMSDYLARVIG